MTQASFLISKWQIWTGLSPGTKPLTVEMQRLRPTEQTH